MAQGNDPDRWLDHFQGEYFQKSGEQTWSQLGQLVAKAPQSKKIIVAGTNGKGETCFKLAASLKSLNRNYACWMSPHVETVRERFQNQDGLIEAQSLVELFQQTLHWQGQNDLQLSYYEFLFASFVFWLQASRPEFTILEVGLGGRLDCTNLFDAEVACLTSIGRDHQEILGSRLSDILGEKLAVTRSGRPLISSLNSKYLDRLTENYCREKAVAWTNLSSPESRDFSTINTEIALHALSQFDGLEFDRAELKNHLLSLELPNRDETLLVQGTEFRLFGSHNLQALRLTLQRLYQQKVDFQQIWFAPSMRDGSEVLNMWNLLKTYPCLSKNQICLSVDHPKAFKGESEGLPDFQNFSADWFRQQKRDLKGARVAVVGSYYFLSILKQAISSEVDL